MTPTEPRHQPISSLVGDLSLALFVYAVSTLGFSSWYSGYFYDPTLFHAQYDHGVYSYRIVGRELVVWVADRLPSNFLAPVFDAPRPGELFTAFVIVNGLAFLGFALGWRVLVRRARDDEPTRTLLYAAGVTVVALSGYVVTPYDQLAMLLLVVFLLVLDAHRPAITWLVVPIVVLGVLTRETTFLALAGAAALLVVVPDRRARLAVPVLTAAGAAVLTYLVVRLAVGGSGSIWDQVVVDDQLSSRRAWVGIVGVVLVYVVWWWLRRACGIAASSVSRRAVLWFYVLASPYVLVILITGYWFELRLVVPLLIIETWLRFDATSESPSPLGPSGEVGSSAALGEGSVLE